MLLHYSDSPMAIDAQPEDTFQFDCCRCGECCRNIRDCVFITSLDAYRIGRHLDMPMDELLRKYFVRIPLEPFGFPILMLRVKAHRDACCFLTKGSCRVQECKPLVCRLYPMNVNPRSDGSLSYVLVSKKPVHYTGKPVRVEDWMTENLLPEDRHFILSWYDMIEDVKVIYRLLIKKADGQNLIKDFNDQVFWHLYEAIDPKLDFWPQYKEKASFVMAK